MVTQCETVAALYVDQRGIYARAGVDPWGVERDARLYAGPWPVVAHPPCQRWGRLGTPRPRGRNLRVSGGEIGADGGCFAAALESVRRWGGILEHPAGSYAWRAFGLYEPEGPGWHAWLDGSHTALVYQSAYGHMAPKATWLYYAGAAPPPAIDMSRPDPGGRIEMMSRKQREATPAPFAEYLLECARVARGECR